MSIDISPSLANNKMCKGLVWTQEAMREVGKGNEKEFDPKGLEVDTDMAKFFAEKGADLVEKPANDDDLIANCRKWYDWSGYGQPWCCMMVWQDNAIPYNFIKIGATHKTSKNKEISIDGSKYVSSAFGFKAAHYLSAGAAMVSAAIFTMQ